MQSYQTLFHNFSIFSLLSLSLLHMEKLINDKTN